MNIIETIKKYPKDAAKVAVVVVLGLLAVLHINFADSANKPFWWNLWLVLGIISIVVLVGGWAYAWIQSWRNRNK